MQTVIDIRPEVYELIQSVASQRRQTLGEVLAEAALAHYRDALLPTATLTRDDQGFPQIDLGRPITLEEVEAAVREE